MARRKPKLGPGLKRYSVGVPTAGVIYVEVEAEDEESAKEKAFDEIGEMSRDDIVDAHEWEMHETICEGNVLHASHNEVTIDEIEMVEQA